MDDSDLLARFLSDGSADAMGELVRRNLDLVYSAARRQSPDEATAEDVTQAVFMLLSRKARAIRGPVAGWLVRATWYAAKNARKLAARRKFHERQAAKMRPEITQEPAWDEYRGELDRALATLNDRDRSAIVLRYLRGLTLREVGDSLGINEDAARKRVDRAIIRLRGIVSREVAVPSVAGFASALASHGTQSAPARLAQSIGTSSATGTAATIAHQAAAAMTWAGAKIAAAIIIAVAVVGAGVGATAVELLQQPAAAPGNNAPAHPIAISAINRQDQQVLRMLAQRMPSVQLPSVAFQDSLDFMRDITGMRINPDWNSLQTIGVNQKSPVHYSAIDTYVYRIFDQILAQVGDGSAVWEISNGAIRISAPAPGHLPSRRPYNLDDLVIDRPHVQIPPNLLVDKPLIVGIRETAKEEKTRQIAMDIMTYVAPDSWNDGREIGMFDRWLLVTQTPDVHIKIEDYLAGLRVGAGPRIRIDADIFQLSGKSIQGDFIEKISTGLITDLGTIGGNNALRLADYKSYRRNVSTDGMSFLIADGQSCWDVGGSGSSVLAIDHATLDKTTGELKFTISVQTRAGDHTETIAEKKFTVALFSTWTGELKLGQSQYLLIRLPPAQWVKLYPPTESKPSARPTTTLVDPKFAKLTPPDGFLVITQHTD